jgi:hypothetical protein
MSENNQTYTWETFHMAGEVWFEYFEIDGMQTPEESTNDHWQEFLNNLNEAYN